MPEEKLNEKTLIKGPKKTIKRISTELFDELAKEGFASIEGLGSFRKSGSGYIFIPASGEKSPAEGAERVSSKIVDLTEEHEPYWLNNTASEKKARIPNAGEIELSDVHIPDGRVQQRVLQDRYEKHKARLIEESRKRKQNIHRLGFAAVAIVAIGILSIPLWTGGNVGEEIGEAEQVEIQPDLGSSEADNSKTLTVSSSELSEGMDGSTANNLAVVSDDSDNERSKESEDSVKDESKSTAQSEEKAPALPSTESGTRVLETKVIQAIGPELEKKEESAEEKAKVKVTPPSQLQAEVAVGNQFAIVAASMKSIPSAKAQVDELRVKGFVAEIVVSPVDGKTFYRVVLGRFETSAEAKEANKALGGEYWVTRLSFASQLLSI